MESFLGHSDAQVLAVCDVNTASHGYRDPKQYLGRKVQQENVNKFYAEKTGAAGYKVCDAYTDFRELLARNDVDAVLIVVPDQSRNFLDCVKSRKDPIAKVEVGHRTASFCHLGNIAMLLKRKIRWDPEKEEIVGDAEAAKMLSRPLRAPWTLWG